MSRSSFWVSAAYATMAVSIGVWAWCEPAPQARAAVARAATKSRQRPARASRPRIARSHDAALAGIRWRVDAVRDEPHVVTFAPAWATGEAAPRCEGAERPPTTRLADQSPAVPVTAAAAAVEVEASLADKPRPVATTQTTAATTRPIDGSEMASVDDDLRYTPIVTPKTPEPQHPPESNAANVDTGKPPVKWQRLTDDWFGVRPALDDRGVSFQASLTSDYSVNLRGGRDTAGGAFRDLLNANVTVDTDRLLHWKGGTFFANFQNQNGQNGNANLVGSAQGISNIDADGRTELSEAWYEQQLLDGKVRLKVGKVDANTEFAHVTNGAEFLNPSMGFSPTIVGFPTYPDPAMSVNAFVNPTEHLYAGVGLYDGSSAVGEFTGPRGPATFLRGGDRLFLIGEVGTKWSLDGGRDGRLGVGVWHHTADFARLTGAGHLISGSTGPYVTADQTLWRKNPADKDDARGFGAFFQYGYADPRVSLFEHHVGGGLTWTGPFDHRDDDVFGLGVTYVALSGRETGGPGGNETTVETFYKVRVLPWLSLKPDLQYVFHPGGDHQERDAFVATVRAVIDF
jgi:porin